MFKEIAQQWRSCGIQAGDVFLIHSSLKRTLQKYHTTPEVILKSFLEAVGPEGTLVLPLFNFDFTRGVPFDIRGTPSQMGALTEAARLYPGAVRSGHPIYSFAAIGPQAEKFNVNNTSGYGPDSPFAVLRELDGKIGVIDLMDQDSMTFYHHIEELHDVDYRYHKEFTADYTGWDGNTEKRTYSLFVRDIEKGVQTDVNPMGEILWDQGLYSGDRPWEGTGLRVIAAREMFDEVSRVIQAGEAEKYLFSIEK